MEPEIVSYGPFNINSNCGIYFKAENKKINSTLILGIISMGLLAFPNLRQLNQQALVKVIKLLHKLLRTQAETLSKIHLFNNCTMH